MIRVAALELPARWNDPRAALADTEALLAKAPCDLALLPELSITGYMAPDGTAPVRPFAEPVDGPTAGVVASMARAHATTIAFPLVERDGDRFYNTIVVVAPDGAVVAKYRKRHRWVVERWATRGDAPSPLFEVAGARMTACICFDLHFVEEEAADALRAADVLLFPSAWTEDEDSREPRLTALARRFDCAVVNANWGPGTPAVKGQGTSMIVSRSGDVVARVTSADATAFRIDAEV